MNILLIVMVLVTIVMAVITGALILAQNMTFDDVVDTTANQTKIVVNQSSRVVGQILEGGY